MISTRFTELVGCTVPIENAGMGTISSPGLAAAVAQAGGLGLVGQPMGPLETFVQGLAALREQTTGAIGVNFIRPFVTPEQVEAAASRVRVADFFWFDPDQAYVEIAHAGGALAAWQVGSAREAKAAADAGCDFVIAQGFEAGGHLRGRTGLLPLLCEVLDAVDIPVLASGGIASPRSLAAVLAAGADGVRLGTAFVAAAESGAHDEYRDELVRSTADDAVASSTFFACPLCPSTHRALRSAIEAAEAFTEETVGEVAMGAEMMTLPRFAGAPPTRWTSGNISAMAMYAGQSVGQIRAVRPAGEIISELVAGAESLLRSRVAVS